MARWDELVEANPDGGNTLQSRTWGDFKARWGWRPERFVATLSGKEVAIQFLVRDVPLLGQIWYAPKGPRITTLDRLREVTQQIREAKLPAVLVKLEPEILADDVETSELAKLGLVRGGRDLQSKSTIFIDLKPTEDELLASFNQSARRSIRKAQNGGVVVEPVAPTIENLKIMFELMRATEARAHYGLRPQTYFTDYWRSQIEAGQGQLLFAKHEGEVLAGIFVTFIGKRGWYKDGGSFEVKRELAPSYLMQWETMRWLKAQGIEQYDMVGVPNRNEIGTGNARDGLHEFKSKFNPDVTEFIGCWDLPMNASKYRLWKKFGERVAGRLAARSPERFLY